MRYNYGGGWATKPKKARLFEPLEFWHKYKKEKRRRHFFFMKLNINLTFKLGLLEALSYLFAYLHGIYISIYLLCTYINAE